MKDELSNSENFIRKNTNKNSGFSSPKNYFINLEEDIFLKLSEENLAKESGFNTPDLYFDKLENSIIAKVKSSKKEVKVVSLKEKVLKMIPYAAAASVILFIGLNSFIFSNDSKFTIDSLSDSDIEYWLDTSTLNTTDINLVLGDDILNDTDFSLTTIKDETIENYIDFIDDSSILNELN